MAQLDIKKFYPKDEVRRAREMDLLTYCMRCEPNNLEKNGSTEYRLRDNHSVAITISKGCWFDHATGEGAYSALSFLILVRRYSLQEAVAEVLELMDDGYAGVERKSPLRLVYSSDDAELREFTLPQKYTDNKRVFAYLRSRGIASEVINHHIKRGALYEDAVYHNAVFVGFDGAVPKYATLRGTLSGVNFKGEVSGSQKAYGFGEMFAGADTQPLRVFESAIDLMSVQTLLCNSKRDWRRGGVSLARWRCGRRKAQ